MFPRTILRDERYTGRNGRENFLREQLAWVLGIGLLPRLVSENPDHGDGESNERPEKNDKQTRRKGLLVRDDRRIKHLHRWNFFCFLDLRHLVLFSKRLENRFLNLRSPVQVRVLDAEKRQFPDGRIHGLAWLGRDNGRAFTFPT